MDPGCLLTSLAADFPLILSLDVASFSSCDPNDLSIAVNYAFSVLPNSPSFPTVEFALDQVKVGFYQFVGWVKSAASSEILKETSFPALVRLSEAILAFLHSALQPIPNSTLIDQRNTLLQSIESLYNPSDAVIVRATQTTAISKVLLDLTRMKDCQKGILGLSICTELIERAGKVIEEQVGKWEGVVMDWMKPDTQAKDCGELVERCRLVADEIDYLEASVILI